MGNVYALFVIITLKGASKLYLTRYSFVVIILSMRVYLSLHVLPFYVFFVFYVFFSLVLNSMSYLYKYNVNEIIVYISVINVILFSLFLISIYLKTKKNKKSYYQNSVLTHIKPGFH